jgi:hypothetical protein
MPSIPPRKQGNELEGTIQDGVRRVFNAHASGHVWRNNTGALPDRYGRWVEYGLAPGSADLIACMTVRLPCPHCSGPLPPIGRFVAIETKTRAKKAEAHQAHWLGLVNAAGGVAGVARSDADALSLIVRASTW